MRAALYCGAFFTGDATGNALAYKLRALRGYGIETRVYAHGCDAPYAPVTKVVATLDEARRDAWRCSADAHLFEFGWTFPLFDLIHEIRPPARSIVFFHGLTPRELLPDHAHAGYERSVAQLDNVRAADLVLCASAFARDFLVRRGVNASRIRIVPLPHGLPRARRAAFHGATDLLFVGRLVPSKGLLDLVKALSTLSDAGDGEWTLSIVFSPTMADRAYADRVRELADRFNFGSRLRFVGKVEDRRVLAELYSRSSAVVVPTYHENYCLPVLEALASGCPVIAYASGAVPEVAAGLAQLVPAGNVAGLAGAIERLVAAFATGRIPIADGRTLLRDEFERRARTLTRPLSERRFERDIAGAVGEVCDWRPSWTATLARVLRVARGRAPISPGIR